MVKEFPAAVLFDWDGTLVTSLGFAARNLGRPVLAFEAVKALTQLDPLSSLRQVFGDENEQAKKLFYRYIDDHSEQAELLCPGTIHLLQTLKSLNIPAAIVSNKDHHRLQDSVSRLGIAPFIDITIGSQSFYPPKPDPFMGQKACDYLDVKSRQTWFVGDTLSDLGCATSLGCSRIYLIMDPLSFSCLNEETSYQPNQTEKKHGNGQLIRISSLDEVRKDLPNPSLN